MMALLLNNLRLLTLIVFCIALTIFYSIIVFAVDSKRLATEDPSAILSNIIIWNPRIFVAFVGIRYFL